MVKNYAQMVLFNHNSHEFSIVLLLDAHRNRYHDFLCFNRTLIHSPSSFVLPKRIRSARKLHGSLSHSWLSAQACAFGTAIMMLLNSKAYALPVI